ncbi:MAG: hypothetical protein MUF54_23825, partial [Polyangiaceae bacterium]|nr:hypothetical protein [Polyangiaceae bacterium]
SSGDLAARYLLMPRSNNREMLFIRTRPDFDSLRHADARAPRGRKPGRAPATVSPAPTVAGRSGLARVKLKDPHSHRNYDLGFRRDKDVVANR